MSFYERSSIPLLPVAAMVAIVAASNYLVQFPVAVSGLGGFLTWGAFTYPVAFLVNDLTNRRFGAQTARRVVIWGFAAAVVLSAVLATPRIALASGTAFLAAQILDVSVFDRMRRQVWWHAPLASSASGSVVDTALFFALAFAGTGLPWVGWAAGDLVVKLFVAIVMVVPFGLLRHVVPAGTAQGS